MRAIVLVGGFGTRLRPLTLTTPKQMLPVVDRPMIEHVVGGLPRHGVDEAVLSLGYRPDAFLAAYPDGRCAGVGLQYAVEPQPLDTAGAIRFAAIEAGIDDTFVVLNGDVLTELDLGALIAGHRARGAEATIALTPVDDPSRYGVVCTDDAQRVTSFVEKPPADQAPSRWINAGVYVLEPSVLGRIPAQRPVSIEREVFPAMAAEGTLFARESDAYWLDVGLPSTFLRAQLDLVDGVRGAPLAPFAADASVDADAEVVHSVLMAGVEVGAGATVRDSVVLPGSVIAPGARVDSSVVGRGCRIGVGAVLEELAVIGDDTTVGDGVAVRAAAIPAAESGSGADAGPTAQ